MKPEPVMLTMTPDGGHYGTLSGKPTKQPDLFTKPNDDGLFPGFSQTWEQLAPKDRR
jgi:hypothetical protein